MKTSEILDHMARCVQEILEQPQGLGGLIAARYFNRFPELSLPFDFFLVKMEDELAYVAGPPIKRWVERVCRMAELERERQAAKIASGAHCSLCPCDATGTKFGFPVCDYHQMHGEDEPGCECGRDS